MKINWFPGHMHKALLDIKSKMNICDVVIYVLDARIPISSFNPKLDEIAKDKKILYILNKSDLADDRKTALAEQKLAEHDKKVLKLVSTKSIVEKEIVASIMSLCGEKIRKYKAKGVVANIRAIVIGIPNSGKSTIVNNLCRKVKVEVGDRAGVTKQGKWLKVNSMIEIYDTPGTLYPNLEDQRIAKKLAIVGSIKDDILDEVFLANELIHILQSSYQELFNTRYTGCMCLDDIARLRGYKVAGGGLDLERTASAVLDDFRKGRIGKITLDYENV